MLLEPVHGVVVSVDYADYLDIALSHNRALFSHVVVVTTPEDRESQRVAGKHDCQLIVTSDGSRGSALPLPEQGALPFGVAAAPTRAFNKGVLIERGLQQLPQDGWRIHFDADILFPGNLRAILGRALSDRRSLYGADRFNVIGWDAYQKLLGSGWSTCGYEHHHFLAYPMHAASVGARLVYGEQGWVPIGYFQCWHASQEYAGIYRTRPYATGSNNAAHDDVQFALRWDRAQRVLIPELYLAHLLTDDMAYGKNWNGRVTRPFAATAAARSHAPGPAGPAKSC